MVLGLSSSLKQSSAEHCARPRLFTGPVSLRVHWPHHVQLRPPASSGRYSVRRYSGLNRIMEPLSSHGVPSVGYRGEWVMSDPAHWPGIASTTRPPLRVTRRSLIVSLYAILVPPHGLCLAPRKPPAWGAGGWFVAVVGQIPANLRMGTPVASAHVS